MKRMMQHATMNGFVNFINSQQRDDDLTCTSGWEMCPYGLYMHSLGLNEDIPKLPEKVSLIDPFCEDAVYPNTIFAIQAMMGRIREEPAIMESMYGFPKYDYMESIVAMPQFAKREFIQTYGDLQDMVDVLPELTVPKMRLVA